MCSRLLKYEPPGCIFSSKILCGLNHANETVLMSILNVYFRDKIRKVIIPPPPPPPPRAFQLYNTQGDLGVLITRCVTLAKEIADYLIQFRLIGSILLEHINLINIMVREVDRIRRVGIL